MMQDLLELVVDINYQEKYSYDERIDLFNKYQIPTSENFLLPVWALGRYIVSLTSSNDDLFNLIRNYLSTKLKNI